MNKPSFGISFIIFHPKPNQNLQKQQRKPMFVPCLFWWVSNIHQKMDGRHCWMQFCWKGARFTVFSLRRSSSKLNNNRIRENNMVCGTRTFLGKTSPEKSFSVGFLSPFSVFFSQSLPIIKFFLSLIFLTISLSITLFFLSYIILILCVFLHHVSILTVASQLG